MEKIENGKYVELGYDLYKIDENGNQELVHQTNVEDPERFVFGVTRGMIVSLEKAVEGLTIGDTFDITVKSDEAFGPHDEQQIAVLDKEIFEVDGKFDAEHIKKGALVPMLTADGYQITGLVVKVTDDKVTMDFNHPLAGKDVRFAGKILMVRDATVEELNPSHGCGCGCGCSEDGCDCDGDCGGDDHCGCGCH